MKLKIFYKWFVVYLGVGVVGRELGDMDVLFIEVWGGDYGEVLYGGKE